MIRSLAALLLAAAVAQASFLGDVRSAARSGDLATAEMLVTEYRSSNGVTPELAEAVSWLGRGALFSKKYDQADGHAAEARKLTLELLKTNSLKRNRNLRNAIGASIEVQAQAMAAQGALSEAVVFLGQELEQWDEASLRTRIQKNLHLLSLEGKPAPALDLGEFAGPKPAPISDLKGKVLLLFFWAHWCPDCKFEAPILARLQKEYGDRGLVVIGPTRLYGFAARGKEADPAQELTYIDQIRQKAFGAIRDMAAPVSEENFLNYGSSTTPTIVLIDRKGIVRLYHPGEMPYDELAPKVAELI